MKKTSPKIKRDVPSRALAEVDKMPTSGLAVVKITSGDDFNKAVEVLSQLNRRLDDVVAEKEKVTKPLNEALRAERERFKPYEKKLEGAIEAIRGAMSSYQMKLLADQKKTADKVAADVAAGRISIDKAVAKLGASSGQAIAGKVSTASGAVKFREDKVVRVTSIELLPKSYMVADLAEIKRALIAGVSVPGAVLDTVQTVVNSR